MGELLLRWRSGKTGNVTNLVKPGTPVQVESLDDSLVDQTVQVFRIPEPLLRRVMQKLRKRLGYAEAPLALLQDNKDGPVLSEWWDAAQAPPANKPTRYVAAIPGGPVSGQLRVTDNVIWESEASRAGQAQIDGGLIGAALGVPLPMTVEANGSRTIKLNGTAFASKDPEVEVRWLNSGLTGVPLSDFLEPYLYDAAVSLELEPDQFRQAFYDEFAVCFDQPGEIAAEPDPFRFSIDEGEAVDVGLALYPQAPGSVMAAVGLVNADDGRPLAASDLLVLTATEDGLIFLDQ